VLGILYCLSVKEPLFHRDRRLFHGFVVGMLFGLEFVCIYVGMFYTDAARAGILINTSPFIVVLGAYFFLKERLGILRIIGLVLAFYRCLPRFFGETSTWSPSMLLGDILELGAAVLWGATTVYIKRYLAGECTHSHIPLPARFFHTHHFPLYASA